MKLVYNPADNSVTYNGQTIYPFFIQQKIGGRYEMVEFRPYANQAIHFIEDQFNRYVGDIAIQNIEDLRINTKLAPTNSGKTTMTPFLVKILGHFGLIQDFLLTAPTKGVRDENLKAFKKVFADCRPHADDNTNFVPAIFMDVKEANSTVNVNNKAVFVCNETAKNTMETVLSGKYTRLNFSLIFIDEVDQHFATASPEDAPVDLGTLKAGDMKRVKKVLEFMWAKGCQVFGHTGTTSASHINESPRGDEFFKPMLDCPSDKDKCRSIRINPESGSNMEESIRVMVRKEIQRIIKAQKQWDNMSDPVKTILSYIGIKHQLQRNSYITVGVGSTNTDKKIVIDSAISIVEDELKNSGLSDYRIAIFTSNDDRMTEYYQGGIEEVSSKNGFPNNPGKFSEQYLDPETAGDKYKAIPTFILAMYKGNSGENIYNIVNVAILRKSSLKNIWRREAQIIGRGKRSIPGVRSFKELWENLRESSGVPSLSESDAFAVYQYFVDMSICDVSFVTGSSNAEGASTDVMTDVYSAEEIRNLHASNIPGVFYMAQEAITHKTLKLAA